jgi:Phosphatidylinositol-glycan biosynthesis class S protein
MAGTRLVIHLCFLVSLLCLVAISALVGLCLNPSDHLCRPLLLQQGRWWLFGNEAEKLLKNATQCRLQENGTCSTASISVAVVEDQYRAWQETIDLISSEVPISHRFQTSMMRVQSVSSHHLSSVCSYAPAADSSRFASPYVHLADLWICEGADKQHDVDSEKTKETSSRSSSPLLSKPRISIMNASMVVTFPESFRLPDRVAFVQGLIPTQPDERSEGIFDLRRQVQHPLHVTLWIGRDQEPNGWKPWLNHLSGSLQHFQHLRSLPCLAPITNQQLPTLSVRYADWSRLGRLGNGSQQSETDELVEQLITAQELRDLVLKPQSRHRATKHGYALHVMLPGESQPVWLVESEHDSASARASFTKLRSNEWVALLDTMATDRQNGANHVVSRWFDQVVRICLKLPHSFLHASVSWADGTIPTFYTKLWLHSEHARFAPSLIIAADEERSLVQKLPWSVVVSMNVASAWKSSLEILSDSAAALADDPQAAMKRLDTARKHLLSLRHNPDLMEPPDDFPLDQYAAILAPLIMPLLLPLLFGLRREVKRYRELRDKKASTPALAQGIVDPGQSK